MKKLNFISSAVTSSSLLLTDLRSAHAAACDGDPLLEILLLDAIIDACRLKERINRIAQAVKEESK